MKLVNKKNILLLLALFLMGFILYSNFFALANNCFDTYDIGLYFQALVNMASGDLNPFVSVRSLNIFNDHFEPILFTAVPSVWLFGKTAFGPIFFEWSIFILFIFSLLKINNFKNIVQILFLVLFCRGILTALVFPIHPNTWSMLAWLGIVYFLYQKSFSSIILCSLSLLLFRESNVFALPGLAVFYFLNKETRKGLTSLLVSLLGLILIFKIRPMILGPSYDYGGYFIKGLLDRNIMFIWERILDFDLKGFLKVFFPLIIPMTYIMKKKRGSLMEDPLVAILLMLAPIFFLHFLAGKIHYHYGITFAAPILTLLILSPRFEEFVKDKRWFGVTLAFFFLTASSSYTKWFKLSVLGKTNRCIISSEKREASRELRKYFDEYIPNSASIFSSGRVVPNLMSAGRRIYVPSHFTIHLDRYDFLLMEKNFGGEFRSLTEDRYVKMLEVCQVKKEKVLIDNTYYFLMKGPIEPSCYRYFSFM